jgi:hypothetical protein
MMPAPDDLSRAMRAMDKAPVRKQPLSALGSALTAQLCSAAKERHRLLGATADINGVPVFTFTETEDAGVEPPRFIPWAWDGFFGASFTITALRPGAGSTSRVFLHHSDPALELLRHGRFYALFIQRASPKELFEVDFSTSAETATLLRNPLDALKQFRWPFTCPLAHFWEINRSQDHLSKRLLTREDRSALEWVYWFQHIAELAEQTMRALRTSSLPSDDSRLPLIMRNLFRIVRESDFDLGVTLPYVGETLERLPDFRPWMHAIDELGSIPEWAPYAQIANTALSTYWQGPHATACGKELSFLDGSTLRFSRLKLDLNHIEKTIGFKQFWARIPGDLRLNWGIAVSGSDLPIVPDFADFRDKFPLASDLAEVSASADALFDEAVENKKWTIPRRALVQLPFGPFSHMEMTEISDNVLVTCRTPTNEFFIINIEPKAHYFDFVPPLPDEDVSSGFASLLTASVKLLLAAVIRDFWVVEEREKVFGEGRATGLRLGAALEGQRVVYLPRIQYFGRPDLKRSAQILGSSERRAHLVSAHLRKAQQASPQQLSLAARYGITVPKGYTFVRPHDRGKAAREVVYRSRSALQSLYVADENPSPGKKNKWFQFEHDVRLVLEFLGFSVEHVSASKQGDRGVDIYARKGHDLEEVCWVIQCKCWSLKRKVGPHVVRDLLGAIQDYPAGTRGMIVTTSSFTSGAREDALRASIRLMDGSEFSGLLKKAGQSHQDR